MTEKLSDFQVSVILYCNSCIVPGFRRTSSRITLWYPKWLLFQLLGVIVSAECAAVFMSGYVISIHNEEEDQLIILIILSHKASGSFHFPVTKMVRMMGDRPLTAQGYIKQQETVEGYSQSHQQNRRSDLRWFQRERKC